MYGGIVTTAFGASYFLSNQSSKIAKCSVDKNITLLKDLEQLAPMIDAKKMLKLFLKEFNTEGHTHVTEDFVIELFDQCGIHDAEIAKHLFRLMDWNNNGTLEPAELAATFTLFKLDQKLQDINFYFIV